MKILMLGGTGVIGSGIYKILSKKHNIHVLNSKIYNRKKNQYVINKKIKFDVFIHAAGVTDEEIKQYGDISSMQRASLALKKLIKSLVANECKSFVYISSQRVYSNFYRPMIAVFDEDKSEVKSTTIYEKCHLASENILKKIIKNVDCKSLIVRPGVVYGFSKQKKKNSRPNLIQYAFPHSLIKNKEIIIKSSGQQFRNFSFNQDIGKIIFNWMHQNKKKKFIISNAKGMIITVLDFAKICCSVYKKLSNKKLKIVANHEDQQQFKKFKITQKIKFRSNLNLNLRKFIENYIRLNWKK
tara:strand:+ start:312 stop:1205 length:894 start_codon:yes stop_codon:yes gene_type:complete